MPPNQEPQPGSDEPSDDGIIRDEYTDPSLEGVDGLDALDVPRALRSDRVLADVADGADGIVEIDLHPGAAPMDTVDSGARHHVTDDVDMGFGAEPHSTDELADATIGHELRGRGAVTRDDEVHGELMF
ncbi:MAG: hypothetical protein ABIW79_04195, partial [Gemmatimonas sp.]